MILTALVFWHAGYLRDVMIGNYPPFGKAAGYHQKDEESWLDVPRHSHQVKAP